MSHHNSSLHDMANDHDDTSSVAVKDPCCRTLQKLTVRAEYRAERNVDAARNMASAEAGVSEVKKRRTNGQITMFTIIIIDATKKQGISIYKEV